MKQFLSFARALFAMVVMVTLVIVFGGIALLVGFIYPSRRLMNALSRCWGQVILWCAGVRLTVKGWEAASASVPAFFLGNHQSDLDIPILLAALRGNVRFLAKDSLFRVPLFGWVIRRYGFAPIYRGNVRKTLGALNKMLAVMKRRPISMTAFPEGTRSPDGRLLPFRRGTMKIVQQAGLPVVPFAIDGSICVHHAESLLRVWPGKVTLTFAEPIPADAVVHMDQDQLARQVVGAVANALGHPMPSADVMNAVAMERGCHTDHPGRHPEPVAAGKLREGSLTEGLLDSPLRAE